MYIYIQYACTFLCQLFVGDDSAVVEAMSGIRSWSRGSEALLGDGSAWRPLRGGWAAGVRLGRIPEACSHNNPSCLCFWYRSAAVDECSWTVSIHVARISLKAVQKFNPDSGRVGPHHRSRSAWGSWGYSTIVAFRFLVAAWPWLIPYAMRNECWNIWNRYPFHVYSWCKAMSRALEALQSEWLSVVKRTFIHLPTGLFNFYFQMSSGVPKVVQAGHMTPRMQMQISWLWS